MNVDLPCKFTVEIIKNKWKEVKDKVLRLCKEDSPDLSEIFDFLANLSDFYINSQSLSKEEKKIILDCCNIIFRSNQPSVPLLDNLSTLKQHIIMCFHDAVVSNLITEEPKCIEDLLKRFEIAVDRPAGLYSGCLGVPLFEQLLSEESFLNFVFFYMRTLKNLLSSQDLISTFVSYQIGSNFKTILLILSRNSIPDQISDNIFQSIIPFFSFNSIAADVFGHLGLLVGFLNKNMSFEEYFASTASLHNVERLSTRSLIKLCNLKGYIVYCDENELSFDVSGVKISSILIDACRRVDDPLCKIYAFETLGLWMKRLIENKSINSCLERCMADAILCLIIDNWEDSVDAVNGKIKLVLNNLVLLVRQNPSCLGDDYFQVIFQFAARMNENRRVKYAVLSSILPYCDSSRFKETFYDFLLMIENPLIGHRVADLCVSVVKNTSNEDCLFWMNALQKYFASFHDVIHKNLSNYFVARVFSFNEMFFFKFVEMLVQDSVFNINGLVTCLNVAKRVNIEFDMWSLIDAAMLEDCFNSCSHSLRLNAFSLLTTHGNKIAVLPPTQLETDLFFLFFRQNSQVSSSEFRQNAASSACNYFKKLSHWYFCKSFDVSFFMESFIECVKQSLNPLACFQRTEIALLLIEAFVESFTESVKVLQISDRKDLAQQQMKLDMIMKGISDGIANFLIAGLATAYTENRNACFRILLRLREFAKYSAALENVSTQCLFSMRPAEADAGAKLKVLLLKSLPIEKAECSAFKMWADSEESISIGLASNSKFLQICRKTSISGIFAALNEMAQVHRRPEFISGLAVHVFKGLFPLADLVYPVLFHQSPEGCLPFDIIAGEDNDLDDIEQSDAEDSSSSSPSQQLACFSWRSLKEYCALVRCLLSKLSLAEFCHDLFRRVCEKFYEMLLNVRHRGAFLSLYDTFLALCHKAHSHPDLCALPALWLKRSVDLLGSVDETLAFTRRSGGLPYLFLALMLSLRSFSKSNHHLSDLIVDLVGLFNDSSFSNASKVHILNVLKAIFKDASLGLDCVPFCEGVFILAIKGFSNTDWAIRNGCLMLFSSLLTRVFGPIRTKSEDRSTIIQLTFDDFFTKFGFRLLECVLSELQAATETVKSNSNLHPSLFPILTLFSRFCPGKCSFRAQEFSHYILKCFFSHVFQLREIAANSLCNITDPSTICNFVEKNLLSYLKKFHKSNNFLHSSLNFMRALLNIYGPEKMCFKEIFMLLSSWDSVPYNRYLLCQINNKYRILESIPVVNYDACSIENIGLEFYQTCLNWSYLKSCFVFCNFQRDSTIPNADLLKILNRNCCVFCKEKALVLLTDRIDWLHIDDLCDLRKFVIEILNDKSSSVILKSSSLIFLASATIKNMQSLEGYFLEFCDCKQPACIRECVVDALAAWMKTNPKEGIPYDSSASISWTLLTLLQDDDEDIRRKAAMLLSSSQSLRSPKSESYFMHLLLEKVAKNMPFLQFFIQKYKEKSSSLELLVDSSVYQKSLFKPEPANLYREYYTEILILQNFLNIQPTPSFYETVDHLQWSCFLEKDKMLLLFLKAEIESLENIAEL